jgi:FHS family glucose/mannose:H+ symporter-like MFS transporter
MPGNAHYPFEHLSPTRRRTVIAAHAGFVLTGVITTLLGPLLPIFTARWSLTDAQAGEFFAAQFVGALLGTLFSGRIVRSVGTGRALFAGYAAVGAGLATLPFGSAHTALIAVFIYGVGLGITIPTTNLLISDTFPERRASALSILNLAWGLGAVLSPPLLTRSIAHLGLVLPLGLLALLLWATGISFLLVPGEGTTRTSEDQPVVNDVSRFTTAIVAITGSITFLYVGTEGAISGWATTYLLRVTTKGYLASAMAPTLFWAALLSGRFLTPFTLKRISADRLTLLGSGLGLAGIGMILLSSSATLIFLAIFLCGLGFAPIFPTTIAQFSERVGGSATRLAGIVFASGALGGAAIPGLVGRVSSGFESLRAGLAVTAVAGLLMLTAQFVLMRRFAQKWPVARSGRDEQWSVKNLQGRAS